MNEQEGGLTAVGRKYFADLQEKMRAILEDLKGLLTLVLVDVKVALRMECMEGTLECRWPLAGHMRYYLAVAAGRCRQRPVQRTTQASAREAGGKKTRQANERMMERTSREWKP